MGEKVLVLQSAPPEAVEKALDIIGAGNLFVDPDITLFGRADELALSRIGKRADVQRVLARRKANNALTLLSTIRRVRFHVAVVFFTGDRGYWKMKLLALLCGAKHLLIFNENLDCFYASAPSLLKFLAHRLKHRVPGPPPAQPVETRPETRKKILVIQSAEPEIIGRALDDLMEKKFFSDPEITAFIRDKEAAINYFADNRAIQRTIVHSEAQNALRHLWQIRKEKYDTMILFFTLDPSYWKVKMFAFLCGAKHILIFNENLDCFFLTGRALLRFLAARMRQQLSVAQPAERLPRLMLVKSLRALLFPFRFVYLLIYFAILRVKKRM